jgi:hypothetical protein
MLRRVKSFILQVDGCGRKADDQTIHVILVLGLFVNSCTVDKNTFKGHLKLSL